MKILALKKGQKVVETLEGKIAGLNSGVVLALGALSWCNLKIYDLKTKQYNTKRVEGPLEVSSFTATIAKTPEGKIGLHPHIVVTDNKFKAFGGHLEEAEVAATFEAVIIESDQIVERYSDSEIGLNLIK